MPAPRAFWVILIGDVPTSFRANEREDLLPTFRQLQRTQPTVALRWVERGKVWESPAAALGAAKLEATVTREKRGKEWRPGGDHKDPKARFELTRDQKRARFKGNQTRTSAPEHPSTRVRGRPIDDPFRAPAEGRPRSGPTDRPKPYKVERHKTGYVADKAGNRDKSHYGVRRPGPTGSRRPLKRRP